MKKYIILSFVVLSALVFTWCNKQETGTDVSENTDINMNTETWGTEDIPVVDDHTTQSAIDWQGTYKWTLPCADCEWIETTITLNQDMTYVENLKYLSSNDEKKLDEEVKWTFVWDTTWTKVTLTWSGEETKSYFVTEWEIQALDAEWNSFTWDIANNYILKKEIN